MESSDTCDKKYLLNTLSKINKWLYDCKKDYTIECHRCNDIQKIEEIYNVTKTSNCPDYKLEDCDTVYILIKDKNNNILSYIGFKIFVKPIFYIDILWTCTRTISRRKGLSTVTIMIPIIISLDLGIKIIVSDSNELSGPLLVKKFGFIWNKGEHGYGDYIKDIGDLVEWKSSPTSYLDLRNTTIKKNTIRRLKQYMKKC